MSQVKLGHTEKSKITDNKVGKCRVDHKTKQIQ